MATLFAQRAHGAQITLAWDASSDTSVAGYKLYWGIQSKQYALLTDVGNYTSETVSNLQNGTTYYFAATAYDARGVESGYSNEVSYTVPSSCTYSISPSSKTFSQAAGTGSLSVTTQSTCSWTASSGASWMTITSGNSGTGSGIVYYSVSANTGTTSRTSASTIAGQTFAVTQAGIQTYTLTITKSGTGSGTVTSNPSGTSFSSGTPVTLTATAGTNSTFTGWSGACSGTNSTCQVTMNGNVSVDASFAVKTYTLTITKSGTGSGTVTSNPSGTSFNAGTVVTLSETPSANSTFSGWSGACSGTSTTCTLTINGNLSVGAAFAANTVSYVITASAGTGGRISPSGSVLVNKGANQTFTMTPNSGYTVWYLKVDGRYKFTSATTYTFSNVTAKHTISVYFRKK